MKRTTDTLDLVLEAGGFSYRGEPAAGLIDARRVADSAADALRYGSLFEPSATSFGSIVDRIYETPSDVPGVSGSPCIYFKALPEASTETVLELRKRVWNQGRSPTLWIVTPESVRIYNSFARPQTSDHEQSHLLRELDQIDEQLLRLSQLDRMSFDSGDFWRSELGLRIDRRQAVDAALLADLTTTEKLLKDFRLPSSVAHALLGRTIFVAYLQDRKILNSSHFSKFGGEFFGALLSDKSASYAFFEWLRVTFNGDLFPVTPLEEASVAPIHLQIVQQFLSGADMQSYPNLQPRLWPYMFDVIPIEMISQIYEMFVHAQDSGRAKAISVHYTRLKLVELVLSLAMDGLDDSLRILDPACGSGVFLVEAFRRLVWLRQRKTGQPLQRDELHELLNSQIFGIDIDRGAVQVAAFSLYLALLELDPDPQPPEALKFPRLSSPDSASDRPINLYVQDFFNTDHRFNRESLFADAAFDLVVGNPPWTALKPATAPRDPEQHESGPQWGLRYCKLHRIPDCKTDQAFMLRACDVARPGARIAFVVASRLIFQQQDDDDRNWFGEFLRTNTFETVVNLSDFVGEDLLFGGTASTKLPASIVIYSPKAPGPGTTVTYVAPKWSPQVALRKEILITSSDFQRLPQLLLEEHPYLWKSAFYGTPRDFLLLLKLDGFPNLKKVLRDLSINDSGRGVTFGGGVQKDASKLFGRPYLDSKSDDRYSIDVERLPVFVHPTAERPRNPWQLPALIASRSLKEDRACAAIAEPTAEHDQIVVNQLYYAISLHGAPPEFGYRLNAILNSRVAFYAAFMRSPALGWDRHLVEVSDWESIPLPTSIASVDSDVDTELWGKALRRERWLRTHWRPASARISDSEFANIEEEMNQAIYRLYGLSDQEIVLIEDTLHYALGAFRRKKGGKFRSLASSPYLPPTSEQRRAYASYVCEQLNSLLQYGGVGLNATIFAPLGTPLIACRFSSAHHDLTPAVDEVELESVAGILERISTHLRVAVADHLFIRRDLRVYDGAVFWIIKPSEARLWTRSSALQDADAVIREHMEVAPLGEPS